MNYQILTVWNDLSKFTFAAIYGSVNLLPWKMKFTPRGKFTQVKNHWSKVMCCSASMQLFLQSHQQTDDTSTLTLISVPKKYWNLLLSNKNNDRHSYTNNSWMILGYLPYMPSRC